MFTKNIQCVVNHINYSKIYTVFKITRLITQTLKLFIKSNLMSFLLIHLHNRYKLKIVQYKTFNIKSFYKNIFKKFKAEIIYSSCSINRHANSNENQTK